MRFGSILMLGLAILFGIAAVVMARHWLESQVTVASGAPQVAVPQVPTKTIVVAAKPLRFGTELRPEHLREVKWPSGAIPSGGFSTIEDILTSEGRRVVLSPIEAREPVLSWKVTGPGERATLSAVVEVGMRAMSVRINDVLGVAGFVLPGDRVDIMLTRSPQNRAAFTDVLLQNVKILAIDQTADERTDKPSLAKTATVEVNSLDAQKLTLAQTVGSLSLALRSAGSVDAAAPRRVTLRDLGPAFEIYADAKEEAQEPTEVELLAKNVESGFRAIETRISQMGEDFTRSIEPLKTEAIPFDPNARVGVIRGMKREEYRVPKTNGRDGNDATLAARE